MTTNTKTEAKTEAKTDDAPALTACPNCDWAGDVEQLAPCGPDLLQRVEPGEIMPHGECPECGALCHADKGPDPIREALEDVWERWDREDTKDAPALALQIARALGDYTSVRAIEEEHAEALKDVAE